MFMDFLPNKNGIIFFSKKVQVLPISLIGMGDLYQSIPATPVSAQVDTGSVLAVVLAVAP